MRIFQVPSTTQELKKSLKIKSRLNKVLGFSISETIPNCYVSREDKEKQ